MDSGTRSGSGINKKLTIGALILIVLVSTGVHFYRISYPSAPVFDEAHFATYAVDYTLHKAFFDIHPALGKLLYAGILWISGAHPTQNQFLVEKYDPATKQPDESTTGIPYGDFPYVLLRSFSALVGILLVIVFYFFLRTIGVPNLGALLGTFFLALDNAFIIQTRLILLDGFLWVLALSALIFYFRKPQRPVLAGILWGLALGVKLSAVVFIGPIIIYYLLKREKKALITFISVGLVVLLLIIAINSLFSSLNDQIATLNSMFGFSIKLSTQATTTFATSLKNYFGITLVETLQGFGNYIGGGGVQNTFTSPWYLWPLKQIRMPYFIGSPSSALYPKDIILDGNPIVWYPSTLAIIFGLVLCYRYTKDYLRGAEYKKGFLILLSGYVLSMLPFILIVHRDTFLYHYLPSLIFGIGLLAWFIAHGLKLDNFDTLTKKQAFVLIGICAVIFIGFLSAAPGTYGL
ncbi:MAG TPA: phospholipid carrier-dependent glycosyltransferase [Candidatus Paceibacterota bacterium]